MRDLTKNIHQAISCNVLWRTGECFSVFSLLTDYGYKAPFSENEEDWTTISADDTIIGYIWKKYPLIFITRDHCQAVQQVLTKQDYLVWIEVDGLYAKCLRLDYNAFTDILNYGPDYDSFSAEDMWFYNN